MINFNNIFLTIVLRHQHRLKNVVHSGTGEGFHRLNQIGFRRVQITGLCSTRFDSGDTLAKPQREFSASVCKPVIGAFVLTVAAL
ncbi:hypothetical protein P3L10_030533 [Capsicum annuum]